MVRLELISITLRLNKLPRSGFVQQLLYELPFFDPLDLI